jgi:hypothetical protein
MAACQGDGNFMEWLTIGALLANATWKANSITDPLTKEKHPYMSSAGHGAIRQFGRTVSSQLIIYCVQLPEQGVPYPSAEMSNALSFLGELQSSSCRQSSILIDAMPYSLPLTSLSLL